MLWIASLSHILYRTKYGSPKGASKSGICSKKTLYREEDLSMSKMELLHAFIGRLENCTKKDGTLYPSSDWRRSYCAYRGIIAVYVDTEDDLVTVCFYPDEQGQHLQTTAGHLEIFEPNYIIITRNSEYFFKEIGIDESERESLSRTYEAMNVPKDVIEKVIAEAIEIGNLHKVLPLSRTFLI